MPYPQFPKTEAEACWLLLAEIFRMDSRYCAYCILEDCLYPANQGTTEKSYKDFQEIKEIEVRGENPTTDGGICIRIAGKGERN